MWKLVYQDKTEYENPAHVLELDPFIKFQERHLSNFVLVANKYASIYIMILYVIGLNSSAAHTREKVIM